jgi:hypothetical protein
VSATAHTTRTICIHGCMGLDYAWKPRRIQ